MEKPVVRLDLVLVDGWLVPFVSVQHDEAVWAAAPLMPHQPWDWRVDRSLVNWHNGSGEGVTVDARRRSAPAIDRELKRLGPLLESSDLPTQARDALAKAQFAGRSNRGQSLGQVAHRRNAQRAVKRLGQRAGTASSEQQLSADRMAQLLSAEPLGIAEEEREQMTMRNYDEILDEEFGPGAAWARDVMRRCVRSL